MIRAWIERAWMAADCSQKTRC